MGKHPEWWLLEELKQQGSNSADMSQGRSVHDLKRVKHDTVQLELPMQMYWDIHQGEKYNTKLNWSRFGLVRAEDTLKTLKFVFRKLPITGVFHPLCKSKLM